MDQDVVRLIVAAITVAAMAWMAGYSLLMRARGVPVVVIAQRNTNWTQRLLIAGGGLYDLYLVLRAPIPALDRFAGAAPSPAPEAAIAVLIAGCLIMAASQAGMGRSWRVGVPEGEAHVDELVTSGLHRFSRNPVYFGVMLFLFGAFLAAPGPFSLAVLLVSLFGLTMIIRQEERYLGERFGERYSDYERRVRRWI